MINLCVIVELVEWVQLRGGT